jgi:hypothetical protein
VVSLLKTRANECSLNTAVIYFLTKFSYEDAYTCSSEGRGVFQCYSLKMESYSVDSNNLRQSVQHVLEHPALPVASMLPDSLLLERQKSGDLDPRREDFPLHICTTLCCYRVQGSDNTSTLGLEHSHCLDCKLSVPIFPF